MKKPALSVSLAARRASWLDMLKLATAVLLVQWILRIILVGAVDVATLAFGSAAIISAALLQAGVFGDRLFLAHEARRTLTESRRTATMVGHMFHDATHVLGVRDRSRAARFGLIFVLSCVVPLVGLASWKAGVEIPKLTLLAVSLLALGATPGIIRLSVGVSGLSLFFAAPKGSSLWLDVALCLAAGLGLIVVSWRQAVSDDHQRFADLPKRHPLSHWQLCLKWGVQFLAIGLLAAAILPKPELLRAPRKGDNAGAETEAGGKGGRKKTEKKSKESESVASEKEADEKEVDQKEQEGGQDSDGDGSGGSGGGSARGRGPGDAGKVPRGGAPTIGKRSDGDRSTGEEVVKPPKEDLPPPEPKKNPWLLAIVGVLLALLVGMLLRKRKNDLPVNSDKVETALNEPSRATVASSARHLVKTLYSARSTPNPNASTVVKLYNELLAHMARIGTPKHPGETPDEFAWRWVKTQNADQSDSRTVSQVFCRAFYGKRDPTPEEFQRYLEASARLGVTPPNP